MKYISVRANTDKYRHGQLRQITKLFHDPPDQGELIALVDGNKPIVKGRANVIRMGHAHIVIQCRIRPTGEIIVNGRPLPTAQALALAYNEGHDSLEEFHEAFRARYGLHEDFHLVRW